MKKLVYTALITPCATIYEVKNPKMRLWLGLFEMKVRTRTAIYTIDVTTAERTMESSIAFSVDYLKRNFSNIKLVSNKEYRKRK